MDPMDTTQVGFAQLFENTLQKLELKELVEYLQCNHQDYHFTDKSEAVAEIIRFQHRSSAQLLLSTIGSPHLLVAGTSIRANDKVIISYTEKNGLRSLVGQLKTENLRTLCQTAGCLPSAVHLELTFSRSYVLLSVMFSLTPDRAFAEAFDPLSIDLQRSLSIAAGGGASGGPEDFLDILSEIFFWEERAQVIDTSNLHLDDVVLDGFAIVKRSSEGRPESIQFLGKAHKLNRLCNLISAETSHDEYEEDCDEEDSEEEYYHATHGDEFAHFNGQPQVEADNDSLLSSHPFRDILLCLPMLLTFTKDEKNCTEEEDDLDWYRRKAKTVTETVKNKRIKSHAMYRDTPGLQQLVDWAERVREKPQATVKVEDLAAMYRPFDIVQRDNDCEMVLFGWYTKVTGGLVLFHYQTIQVQVSSEGRYARYVKHNSISRDNLGYLPVLVGPEEHTKFIARGQTYCTLSQGNHFVSHRQGALIGVASSKVGRIMLEQRDNANACYEDEYSMNDIDHLLCVSTLQAFSFTHKCWTRVRVEDVEAIRFNEKAFDQLVLEPDRKTLVYGAVMRNRDISDDIIPGKGGSTVFLLHGPPGTGKTLTAEAVAETLKRPLYYVSMGELGTDPVTLETNLLNILNLASRWEAIVLMDEADIFLEQRDYRDVKRNAMVGVMMRLLEYYHGIFFLTSNRVQTFDRAFYSRITLALRYDSLDRETRCSVWKMLLGVKGLGHLDANVLCDVQMNGRQIKNCISLAKSVASSEGREVTYKDLVASSDICKDFVHEMKAMRDLEASPPPSKRFKTRE
ncbi:hypothetical protein PROFUN_06153 [Planoprotostelium fungivorum]|uniref:AAA+ ATPase domain-containing protein n=1 Tax=Planoprotostelium fungivorum TaxID=1890364 RepID=A0A2P6NPJ5_9EUKA|nr:hypothetical protein PROFUN_06153 [Planoprotostelium fungivorum]